METENPSPDSYAQEISSNESDTLLDQSGPPEMAQSVKKRLLIYAFPALLLWYLFLMPSPRLHVPR